MNSVMADFDHNNYVRQLIMNVTFYGLNAFRYALIWLTMHTYMIHIMIHVWCIKPEEIKQTSMHARDSIPLFSKVKLFFLYGRAINGWMLDYIFTIQ